MELRINRVRINRSRPVLLFWKNPTQIDCDTWVSILEENQIAVPDGIIILTTDDRSMDFEYMGSVRKLSI